MPTVTANNFTKFEAIKYVRDHGYTEHYDTGSCGDGGYGSRLYYRKKDGGFNKFGAPLEHATISLVDGRWFPAIFAIKDKNDA